MKSWETTLAGLGALLVAVGVTLKYQFDGDIATVPDWDLVIVAAIAFVGLWRARDNNKTSEKVKAKA